MNGQGRRRHSTDGLATPLILILGSPFKSLVTTLVRRGFTHRTGCSEVSQAVYYLARLRGQIVEMGTYNLLHILMPCPRCGATDETEIECHFGNTSQMLDLKIGRTYPWVSRKQPQNGGRPEGGNVDGEGYFECRHCKKDSIVHVLVRGDVIKAVEPNTDRPGFIQSE